MESTVVGPSRDSIAVWRAGHVELVEYCLILEDLAQLAFNAFVDHNGVQWLF